MVQKLHDALAHKKSKQKTEDEDIFKYNYTEEIQHLSISFGGIKEQSVANRKLAIKGRLEFIADRTKEMQKWMQALEDAKDEKSRILSN